MHLNLKLRAPRPLRTAVSALMLASIALSPALAQQSGGSVAIASQAINSLDPQGTSAGSTGTGTVAKAVFSTLVKRVDRELVPSLATEWTADENGRFVFTLDDSAVYSDGTPVVAADVVASFERLREIGGPYASLFGGVTAITADGEHGLVIETGQAGSLLHALTLLYVAPADRIADEAFWQAPVGSGPFTVEQFVPGERVRLVRNEQFWGEPALLDAVEFANIPEVSGQMTALEIGDVDIAINVPLDQVPAVDGMADVSVVTSEPTTVLTFWLNNGRAPLDDVRVRQALWHAVDWETVRQDLYGDAARPATAAVASSVFGWAEQQPYAYDVDKAKALLAEAGHPDGFEVTLKYNPAGGFSQAQLLVETAVSYWAAVGVTVNIVPQEQAVYLQDLLALEWDITPLANTSRTGDADQILGRLYNSSAKRLGLNDPAVDEQLALAAKSSDQAVRQEAYAEVNTLLWDNAVAIWPMELAAIYAVNDRVQGFAADPSSVPDFSTVWVED